MYSILFLVIALCCAVFYFTSTKIKFKNIGSWRDRLLKNKKLVRGTALFLLALIGLIVCWDLGPASGIFSFFTMVMTALSLFILLYPYGYLKWKHLGVLFILCLALELTYSLI